MRMILLVLAASQAAVGGWALTAPASFFTDFPGGGPGWVSALPPFNEHLVRDVGALSLALGVVLAGAAWILERRVVVLAVAAFLVYSVPHLLFHQHHLEGFTAVDALLQQGGLVVQVALAATVLVLASRRVPSGVAS